MVSDSYVQTQQLVKEYGTSQAPVPVLRSIDMTIAACERVALLGKSGSGKSTLLHLLAGLDVPTSGSIRVGSVQLSALNRRARALYRRNTVGIIFQAFHLIPMHTAIENVAVPLMLSGMRRTERRKRAQEMLEAVGLGHRISHRPAELSGGERQRVAVARALINRPALILADEPTGNLDSCTGQEVLQLILDHVQRERATLLMVTHDEELARRSAERILRLHDGQWEH